MTKSAINLDIKHIRIVNAPVSDDGSGLMYREHGKFYRVRAEHPSIKPLPEGCRDIVAALIILPDREHVLFVPIEDAQQIIHDRVQNMLVPKIKK